MIISEKVRVVTDQTYLFNIQVKGLSDTIPQTYISTTLQSSSETHTLVTIKETIFI